MKRLFWMTTVPLLALACANERPQRAPGMDPSNPDAPAGQVTVPTALTAEEKTMGVDEAAHGGGHDHGAVKHGAADAGPIDHGQHMTERMPAEKADAGAVYSCPMHPEVRQTTPGRCPKCGMKLVLEATDAGAAPTATTSKTKDKTQPAQIYTCPMHPEVQQKGPGECPKCGMKLVPKEKPKASTGSGHGGHEGH